MEKYIILICLIAIAAILAFVFVKRKKAGGENRATNDENLTLRGGGALQAQPVAEMTITFESLPALTEEQNAQLVEIKDSKLLARIDNAVPGTVQAVVNSGAAAGAQAMAKDAGNLYRAIIPQGAVLDNSRAMEGAVRGSYRVAASKIKGNANWVKADGSAAKGLATVNVANAAMGVASMVVGQYYMTQINDQLDDINSNLDAIASFQGNEFKSKVMALVVDVQKTSKFQMEIMESDELRRRELDHLKALENSCAQLLGQANLTLDDFSKKSGLDYDSYEKQVGEAESWYQYQRILLQVMCKIAELTYALNLGAVSREYCLGLIDPYANQSKEAWERLKVWHSKICASLKIDVDEERRKRQGLSAVFMKLPGLFNNDLNYKAIPKTTVKMIKGQSSIAKTAEPEERDLFKENVQLIAKEGKLYYLPAEKQ